MHGAYIYHEDDPLEFSAAEVQNSTIIQLVLKYGKNPNISNEDGSILHIAINNDNERVSEYIIDRVRDFDFSIKDEENINVILFY